MLFRSFNDVLKAKLEELHVTRRQPMDQSVVGGTQTPGNLLRSTDPVIRSLNESIHATLKRELDSDFFNTLGEAHPVLVAKDRSFYLRASWSIWVTEGGYHQSHVHSRGWYSSAYYVGIPSNLNGNEGALAFGRPDLVTSEPLEADKLLPPQEGILNQIGRAHV